MGLPVQSHRSLHDELVHDLLVTLYRKQPLVNDDGRAQRIEQGYAVLYGQALQEQPVYDVRPVMALGQPGQGLSVTYREALQDVAVIAGMDMKINPAPDTPVGPNDLVLFSQELNQVHQDQLDDPRSARFQAGLARQMAQAGGGVVLLDLHGTSNDFALAGLLAEQEGSALKSTGMVLAAMGKINPSIDVPPVAREQFTVRAVAPNAPKVRPHVVHEVEDVAINALLQPSRPSIRALDPVQLAGFTDRMINAQVQPPVLPSPTEGATPQEGADLANKATDLAINARLMQKFPSLAAVAQKLNEPSSPTSGPATIPTDKPSVRRQP